MIEGGEELFMIRPLTVTCARDNSLPSNLIRRDKTCYFEPNAQLYSTASLEYHVPHT